MISFASLQELSIAIETGSIATPTFVSLRSYENKQGEVSNYLLNLGTNYRNAQMADLMMLEFCNAETWEYPPFITPELKERAHRELKEAAQRNVSDNIDDHTSASRTQLEMYDNVMPNVKVHIHTGTVYVHGMLIRKTVVEAAEYPTTNKRNLTVAKDVIRRDFTTGKYRQFFLSKIHNIKVNGKELIFELNEA